MKKYDRMTTEDFDNILVEILQKELNVGAVLHITGVYEILAEYYNNDVLEIWEERQQEDYED
jgi:hypothetical protein